MINFQTYLSCGRAPKGLRSSCRPAVSLDLPASEINIVQELQNAHLSAVLQLSLTAACRKSIEATEALSSRFEELRQSPDRPDMTALRQCVANFSSRLDKDLFRLRHLKWERARDGVRPQLIRQTSVAWATCPQPQTERRWTRRAGKKRRDRAEQRRTKRTKVLLVPDTSTDKNGDQPSPISVDRTVIDLLSSTLSTSQHSLLQKGMTLCPTAFRINHLELTADLHAFYRRLRLQEYFLEKPASWTSDKSALEDTSLNRHSSWQPIKGTYAPEVDVLLMSSMQRCNRRFTTRPALPLLTTCLLQSVMH